jgi:hypothetical protein
MSIDEIIKVSGGLLTPLIAIVATYIAWQQWKGNQRKLLMDQYDRRLRIYEEVRKILIIVTRDVRPSPDDLLRFKTSVSEADFLFGPEIVAYIAEIYKRGLNLWRWNQEYRDDTQKKPEGYNHAAVVDEMHKEIDWFAEQFDAATQKFKKYLCFSK